MHNVTIGFDVLLRSFTKKQGWWVFYSQYELRQHFLNVALFNGVLGYSS